MSRYVVTVNQIEVIGHIWQPGVGVCAMTYSLSRYDLENLGELTRDNVEQWLMHHSGDFQEVVDFRADIGDWESPWTSEDNEYTFLDCTSEE